MHTKLQELYEHIQQQQPKRCIPCSVLLQFTLWCNTNWGVLLFSQVIEIWRSTLRKLLKLKWHYSLWASAFQALRQPTLHCQNCSTNWREEGDEQNVNVHSERAWCYIWKIKAQSWLCPSSFNHYAGWPCKAQSGDWRRKAEWRHYLVILQGQSLHSWHSVMVSAKPQALQTCCCSVTTSCSPFVTPVTSHWELDRAM